MQAAPGTTAFAGRCAGLVVVIAVGLVAGGCAPAREVPPTRQLATAADADAPALSPALDAFLDAARHAPDSTDVYEVWVCDVPQDTTDPVYYPSEMRLDLAPESLAGVLTDAVPAYFDTLSGGRYAPAFAAGGVYRMAADDAPADCLDAAIGASAKDADAVLAIATAEHQPTAAGGFSRPGVECPPSSARCPAAVSGRAVYLGASDFHPDWGAIPALDLLEHEMGHVLGWPHSGWDPDAAYDSDIDVMSNSAAPRETDPARRHAPGTIGVNRLEAGWLDRSAVAILDADLAPATVRVAPSGSRGDSELLVLPVSDDRFLTVEYLADAGLYDYLPEGGVAVTLVDLDAADCDADGESACASDALGFHRTMSGSASGTPLLTAQSPVWSDLGWTVTVESIGDDAVLRVDRG